MERGCEVIFGDSVALLESNWDWDWDWGYEGIASAKRLVLNTPLHIEVNEVGVVSGTVVVVSLWVREEKSAMSLRKEKLQNF